MKILLFLLLTSLSSLANQTISELDCGGHRYVYFDGNYFNYVWLSDDESHVIYQIKSIYSPSQMKMAQTGKTKEVQGQVISDAEVK